MQQQLGPIWDAIDDEQFAYALQLIEKAQKRYRVPNVTLLGLQGLCLCRVDRPKEAVAICERLRKEQGDKKDTYQTIHDILKAANDAETTSYLIGTMEAGFRLLKSEFMGRMWFIEAVRAGNLVAQRKAAVELQKGFVSRDYFYFVLISMLLLYERKSDAKEKVLLGMLMYRMVTKAAENIGAVDKAPDGPRIETKEEFHLYLDILRALGKEDEMLLALKGYHGQRYDNDHDLLLLKLELSIKLCKYNEAVTDALKSIEQGTDDWLVFKAYIDAALAQNIASKTIDETLRNTSAQPTRNRLLSCVYLSSSHSNPEDLLEACAEYLEMFPDKLATYEDLAPFTIKLSTEDQQKFLTRVAAKTVFSEPGRVILSANACKFRLLFDKSDSRDQAMISACLQGYTNALQLGHSLTEQDNQYGDDLLLLAVQEITHSEELDHSLLQAIVLLEHGLTRSKHNFQFRLLLIKLYRRLGAWSAAHVHFQALGIKHVQRDTLSYILLEDSLFEYLSSMQLTSLQESQHIYNRNQYETPDMICQAYENKTYSKIPEFLDFKDRLDDSIWWYQSQANSWTLQLMLDKFSCSTKMTNIGDTKIYDNKSRHVMLDIHHINQTAATRGPALANQAELACLKEQMQRVLMIKAILSGSSLDEMINDDRKVNQASELIQIFYMLRFDAASRSSSLQKLEKVIDSIDPPKIATADALRQEDLHKLGRVVELLKYCSLMLPHAKNMPSSLKTKIQAIHTLTRSLVENLRQAIVNTELKVSLPSEVQIMESFKAQVLAKIKIGRKESVTCLLGVLKTMKL